MKRKRHTVKIEEMAPGLRWFYEYQKPTPRGERIVVELCRCENPGGSNSLPVLWNKNGHTSTVLDDWWGVQVYAYDSEGNCWGRYNPTEKHDVPRPVIDFKWMLSATEENREKLLREIERRAFGEE